MCGRFTASFEFREIKIRFSLQRDIPLLVPRYNIAPSQEVPVIVQNDGKNELMPMKWGLVPAWSSDKSIGERMINARAETITEKPSFRRLVESKRCVIPADGFYEWRRVGSELAEQVFSTVTELATRLQLEICLMHVVIRVYFGPPEGFLPVFSGNIPNQKQLWAEAGAQATEYLARKVEQLRAQGVPRVSSVLIEGSAEGAAAEIIDRGSKTSNALVIMSTHGRSGIGRWLIGSVTERVVRHSLNPVLVTRSHPNGLDRFL